MTTHEFSSPARKIADLCRAWSLLMAAVLLLATPAAKAADTLPDLRPYQPTGWSAAVVLSDTTGTTTSACPVTAGTVYLDWAIANYGSVAATQAFVVRLQRDGTTVQEWTLSSGLAALTPAGLTDYKLTLTTGPHTIKLIVDAGGTVAEGNETNNEYSTTVTVLAAKTLGSLTVRPTSYDFGTVASGRTATRIFTFSNGGPGGLALGAAALSGTGAGAYTIAADTCSGKTLPPRDCSGDCAASCTVTVAFTPTQADPTSATLSVADTTKAVQSQVALSGAAAPGIGDFNGDGSNSLADVLLLLQVMNGMSGGPSFRLPAAIDGGVRAGLPDAIHLLQSVAGLRGDELYDLVRIETDFGAMLIWLYAETPIHRDNFLALARQGYYNDMIFHRVIKDFVIQGGDPLGTGTGGPGYTLCVEINAALLHDFGAVAAARLADTVNPERNSSGSQFYIVADAAEEHTALDGKYTVFGKVIDGRNVITTIAAQATNASTDKPLTNIVMKKVEVVSYSARQLRENFGFTVESD